MHRRERVVDLSPSKTRVFTELFFRSDHFAHKVNGTFFPQILHQLTIEAVVEQLEKVFFKSALRELSILGVFRNVGRQPPRLFEANRAVYSFYDETFFEVELEIPIVNHVLLFGIEVRYEFTHRFEPSTSKKVFAPR